MQNKSVYGVLMQPTPFDEIIQEVTTTPHFPHPMETLMTALHRCTLFQMLLLSLFLLPAVEATAQAPKSAKPKTAAAAPAAPKPQSTPDVIEFTNGDRITGQMERIVGQTLFFKSDMAGELTIDLGKVKEMHSNGSYALIRSDAVKKTHFDRTSIAVGTVDYDDKKLTVADPMGEAQTVETKQVAYVIDQPTFDRDVARKAHWNEGWTGTLTGGATLVRATQNTESFTGAIAMQRAVPLVTWLPKADRVIFNLSETYGKVTQTGTPFVLNSIFHTAGEHDRYISARFYYLEDVGFDHNYSQGLQLSQNYGAGLGWTAIQKPTRQMDLKADLHFLGQEFQTASSNENLVGTGLTETFKQTLPHKVVFTQAFTANPAWNYEQAFTASATAGLNIPVYKRFSMTMQTSDSFLNDPAPTYKKNSFQVVTGFSYSLK